MVWHVEKGKKYVIMKEKEGGNLSFKEVICESEITNFSVPQLEIETIDGEYYSLSNVYKTKEEAFKDYLKNAKRMKNFCKRSIKEKEKEIKEDEKMIIDIDKSIKNAENKYKELLKKGK